MFSRYPVLWLVHMQTLLWCILHTVSYRCLLHRIVIAMLLHENDVECLSLRVPSPMDSFVWMLSPSRWQSLPKLTRCLPRPPTMSPSWDLSDWCRSFCDYAQNFAANSYSSSHFQLVCLRLQVSLIDWVRTTEAARRWHFSWRSVCYCYYYSPSQRLYSKSFQVTLARSRLKVCFFFCWSCSDLKVH